MIVPLVDGGDGEGGHQGDAPLAGLLVQPEDLGAQLLLLRSALPNFCLTVLLSTHGDDRKKMDKKKNSMH